MKTEIAAIKFTAWNDLFTLGRTFYSWFFRGQSNSEWALTSSLERAIGVNHGDTWRSQHTEEWMLRKFQGFAHNYLTHLPAENDRLEWLALMQHHGAPTRLLDCTFSFPVAAFFAASEGDSDFAIWAFNWNRLRETVTNRFGLAINPMFAALEFHNEMHKKANEFLTGTASGALAFPVQPRRSNERLEAQQGMFLFPSDAAQTLQENLERLIGQPIDSINDVSNLVAYDANVHKAHLLHQYWLLKFVLPRKERFNVLTDLQTMNIHEASLFPGLDGFTRSLKRYTRIDK